MRSWPPGVSHVVAQRDWIAVQEAQQVALPTRRHADGLDGIRTLAILGVVLYHANVTMFPGGFIGVTVFFVLSGYLITDSLLKEVSRGSFPDLKRFYGHRLRRLWPTMLVVIAIIAIVTSFAAPDLFVKLQGDALPSALFFDNWWYILRQQSYFAAAGQPSPLTHFWYLGVVGQFYLVWPFVIWGLRKLLRKKRACRRAMAVIALASFVAGFVMFQPGGDPSRVYYGFDTRLVELALGSWLAFYCPLNSMSPKRMARLMREKPRPLVDLAGVVAIVLLVVLCFTLSGYSDFLFRGALLGVAALTCVLTYSVTRQEGILAKVLGLKPFQVVSSRSFAVYLWHYPLLLLMNPATRTTVLPWWGWVLEFAAIIAISELSYRFVEEKTAHGQIGEFFASLRERRMSYGQKLVGGVSAIVAVFCVVIISATPFWCHVVDQQEQAALEAAERQKIIYQTFDMFMPRYQAAVNPTKEYIRQSITTLKNKDNPWTVDPVTGATNCKVLLIGDSVAAGAEMQFPEIFPDGYIDGAVNRRITEGPDIYSADTVNYTPDVVVFELGTNGLATEEQVRELIECVGGRSVYLLNTRVPQASQDLNNELIAQVVAEYGNAQLIDWYGYSQGHDDWFYADGTHLKPTGAENFCIMIRKAVVGY